MIALLVDGLNLVRRIHAAVPGDEGSAEHDDGVLHSAQRSLERALGELHPTHALCAFDAPGESWRHRILPGYKADRPPMPVALARLLPTIEDAFDALGVRKVRVAGFEADDVLASIAVKIAAHGGRCVILSTDKSMLSLLGSNIRVRNHFDGRDLDEAYVRERFGVTPRQLPLWLALVGERSQGIPGVKSVGRKTAAQLIEAHGSLGAMLAAAEHMSGRIGEALRVHAEDARLSLRLATLRTDVDVGLNLNACRVARATDALGP